MSRFTQTLAAVMLVGSFGLAACGGGSDDPKPADGATVELKPTTFEPADVTVKVGETVTWKWGGGVQHDVVGEGFKSKLQAKGEYSHTYDTAGTFKFKCEVHPSTMQGTVTVS